MRRLNIEIRYIPESKNKVTDVLSKTLFDEDCESSSVVFKALEELNKERPKWM